MKNVAGTINEVAGAFVTLVKGLVVAAVFANILFTADTALFDPVAGIIDLVNEFLGGGLAGLLALMVFASFSK